MKILCTKNNLLSGINIVLKAVPTRTTLNILECILIDTTSGEIKLTANDMELGIETIIEGEVSDKGLIAINAKIFSEIIRRLPEAGIETGVNADGSPNKINQFIRILCEEVITEIKDNSKVTCVLQPGTLNSVGTGGNAAGPVVVTSYNTIPLNIMGIIQ